MKHKDGEDMPESREEVKQLIDDMETELTVPHGCQTELRIRTVAGGAKHYVHQCQICGRQQGGPKSAGIALRELKGGQAIPFDLGLADTFDAAKTRRWNEYMSLKTKLAKLDSDPLLAQREADDAKRQKAIKALEELVTTVSAELSEAEALRVLQNHLVTARTRIWQAALTNTKRFSSEPALKGWLVQHLSRDFELIPEVRGTHLAKGIEVYIDYVVRAKPHLIAAGFTEDVFGIEVKHLKPEEDFSGKTSRGFWQTISYTDCEFTVDGTPVLLKFALLFSDFSFDSERTLFRDFGGNENDRVSWESFRQLANHAQVGTLYIKGTQDDYKGWSIRFSGGIYFTARGYKGDWTYRLSNTNLITKSRIGNF